MWQLLEECERDLVWSGTVLRVFIKHKTEFYYTDQIVDLMFFNNPFCDFGLIGLIMISGAKAGYVELMFPPEAYGSDTLYAIQKSWLVDNLHEHLNLDKANDKVFIKDNISVLPFI
ncbi:Imm45 family immunity protein [Acinetobacter rudis]|uniref:Imm45 family immunity protein n=1 Tax=Acinetobacter rudis TaxID=632955 RepID=UPI00280DF0DF|nr:Imm45 family immunity protein [Acinetobacter rudis]MDQ8953297.1 Imm45 family immunity protein [Acinetobacter rudis]